MGGEQKSAKALDRAFYEALDLATLGGDVKGVKALVEGVSSVIDDGPLEYASLGYEMEMIGLLYPFASETSRAVALQMSASLNRLDSVERLISLGATPLEESALLGSPIREDKAELVRALFPALSDKALFDGLMGCARQNSSASGGALLIEMDRRGLINEIARAGRESEGSAFSSVIEGFALSRAESAGLSQALESSSGRGGPKAKAARI